MKDSDKAAGVFRPILSLAVIFSTIIISGCFHFKQPVILRNRPDVPPPVVTPSETPNAIQQVSDNTNIDQAPPIIITVPSTLPPPDIKTAPITYTVVKGDSFWKIANMYGVTQKELAVCNNLSLDKPLPAGTVLLIPPGGVLLPPEKRAKHTATTKKTKSKPRKKRKSSVIIKTPQPTPGDGSYVVHPGDSLWSIARKFKVTRASLAEANGISVKNPVIRVGSKMVIPGRTVKSKTKTAPVEAKQPKPTMPAMPTPPVPPVNKGTNSDDDLLNNALNAAGKEAGKKGDTPSGLVEELDKATDIVDSELPQSMYTEEVIPGETLQEIADRHGLTPEEIRAVNSDIPPDGKLKPFTSIKIPNK